MSPPTLLAIDGNSVLHRCFHAAARTGFRTADGRAAWAVRGLLSMLGAAVDRACADAVVVGFDDPEVSVRRDRWPVYKAHRLPKPATLDEQLETAVQALCDLGVVLQDGRMTFVGTADAAADHYEREILRPRA